MGIWTSLQETMKLALKEVFPSYPFHLVGKKTDELTFQTFFLLKAKRVSTPISLSVSEILADDKYFLSLHPDDRKKILQQLILETKTPLAYIQEYPIHPNNNNQCLFKIFLIEEKKIICGTASYFMREAQKKILSKLDKKDIIRLAMAYYEENFLPRQKNTCLNSSKELLK